MFRSLKYRTKSWAWFFWNFTVLKGKNVWDPRKFQFITLPKYPQIDSNITYIKNEGATNLIPFCGKDVK